MGKILTNLFEEVNQLTEKSQKMIIEGFNELADKKIEVTIDLEERTIDEVAGLDNNSFASLLWRAGILPAENEEEIAEKINNIIRQDRPFVFGLVLDTNLIISRFIPGFFSRHYKRIGQEFKGVIIIPRATNHEFHYKEGYSYSKDDHLYLNFKYFIEGEAEEFQQEIGQLLTRQSKDLETFLQLMKNLPSINGRIGSKGCHELRYLQNRYPVILSKPDHLYYSPIIQIAPILNLPKETIADLEKGELKDFSVKTRMPTGRGEIPLIDAIFDSLIRYEIDFFKKNTNTEMLFLTADKQQSLSSTSEGMESLYVKQPTSWYKVQSSQPRLLKNERISELLFELMIYSPYIRIKAKNKKVRSYAYNWTGKTPEENLKGLIRKFIPSKGLYEGMELIQLPIIGKTK